MSSTSSGQWLWIHARQCSVTPRKSNATVSTTETTEHSRLHSCWWVGDANLASYSPDLNPLHYCIWDILHDLVYEDRFDFRLQGSTRSERGNQKQMEGGHHWESSKIHRTMEKNDWMRLENRMEARFSTFSAENAVTGYRSHAVRRVELTGYFVRFGHSILFCVFRC